MDSDIPKGAKRSPEPDHLFRLDTRGDRQNLTYQGLHQASIPKYRTAGRGNVIGLDTGFKILRSSESRRKVVASGLDSNCRPRQHTSFIAEPQSSKLVRPPREHNDTITDQTDYVAIDSFQFRKRRLLSTQHESESSDESDSANRTDSSNLSAPDAGTNAFQDRVLQRQRELSESTSKQPEDSEAWFSLLELQADVVRSTTDQQARLTNAQRRTVSDLKISLYREALSKVKDPPAWKRLIVGLMREGRQVWDRSRQLAEWLPLIKKNPSFDLSLLYLNFLQTDHSQFSYDRCLQAYRDWLKVELDAPPEPRRDGHCLYILLRLTMFMKQSGYGELATAIWQCMIEFNLYRPTSLALGQELSALEGFWDKESPRFGEPGAKGWKSTTSQDTELQHHPPAPSLLSGYSYREWYVMEKNIALQASLPARTLDDTLSEDPYRVVLFSDVRDFVFQLSSNGSETWLVDAFLCYSGLPPIFSSPVSSLWQADPLLYPALLRGGDTQDASSSSFWIPFSGITNVTTLFTPSGPFSALKSDIEIHQPSSWSSQGIEQLALSRPQDECLGTYAIALTMRRDTFSARKLARRLIRNSPNSAMLYNAYALVESALGNDANVDKVWQTTITMKSKSNMEDPDLLLLWRTRVFNALCQRSTLRASKLLQSMLVDPSALEEPRNGRTSISEALALTEYKLQSHLTKAISSGPKDAIVLSTDILGMLRYCQSNQDLGPVLETYQNVLQILESKDLRESHNQVIEAIHQGRNQLVYLHTSSNHGPYEPKQILQAVSQSLKSFPRNSTFIELHDHYQRRHGFMDRLRAIATDAVSSQTTGVLQHALNIKRELALPEDFGTTEHSIRAAFARANEEDSSSSHCPSIRVAHLQWEISLLAHQTKSRSMSTKQDRKRIATVVQALHAAIRACPWVKELYLLAFKDESIRRALEPAGMKEVYETMVERGLRVHHEICEKVE